ncbi:MAG: NADH-ubiquinone oxidoreductase-F iron-sulfur binding region domain-containing protein [Patescibacteria group bacterium]
MMVNIIEKMKKANLKGRSGAGFPTGSKWEMVEKEKAEKKYIICNASEGDPTAFKDKYILDKYAKDVIEGIKIALETIDNSTAYIYLKKDYFKIFESKLRKLIGRLPITLFKKTGGYLAGEETAILEGIEGRRPEPRIKPPFPYQKGLFGYPTLMNNVETFYQISQIAKDRYQGTRFFCVSGDAKKPGVFELKEDLSLKEILEKTGNWPDFDFFISAGGTLGDILLPRELNQPLRGIGSIVIYKRKSTDAVSLMKKIVDFVIKENCGRCTPCREGAYRLKEILEQGKMDKKIFEDVFFVLRETSLCPLGRMASLSLEGIINKIYGENGENQD